MKRRTTKSRPTQRRNKSSLTRHLGTVMGLRWAMRSVLRSQAMRQHPFLTVAAIAGLAYLGVKAGQAFMRKAPATAGLLKLVA